MLASLLASFPFQLWFISSNISIKHFVSGHYRAHFCTGCLFLREMKRKSMCLAHVEGAFTNEWVGRHTQTVLWDNLNLRPQFPALLLGDKFPNLSKPPRPSCWWGRKWKDMCKESHMHSSVI